MRNENLLDEYEPRQIKTERVENSGWAENEALYMGNYGEYRTRP